MATSQEPIVCTLTDQDAKAQALEWVDLQGLALSKVLLPSGTRMTFAADQAPRITDLAEREAACCAFLNIVTSIEGDRFVVEITADNADAIALIALLTSPSPA